MKLKRLLADDEAVSPVIGVILMVAITVILAAVIATFVLGLGDQVSNTAPQATFSYDWDGASGGTADLRISHDGGGTIEAGNIHIRGDLGTGSPSPSAVIGQSWDQYSGGSATSQVSAGNSITLEDPGDTSDSDGVGADGEITVVWEPSSGQDSATLSDWTGPDA